MKPTVKHTPDSDEYYFKEGCHILEMSNSTADEAVSVARARVEPLHDALASLAGYR